MVSELELYNLRKAITICGEETVAHWRAESDFTLEAVFNHCLHPGELVALVFRFLLVDQWFSREKVVRLNK